MGMMDKFLNIMRLNADEEEDFYDDDYYDDDDDYELEREILDEDEGFFDKRSGKKRGIDLI